MPEAKYFSVLTAGEFTGARTFAEQVKHLAANNYRMAARMLGQTPTPDQEAETGPDAVRSKPEILHYLKGLPAALHRSGGGHNCRKRGRARAAAGAPRHGEAEHTSSVCRRRGGSTPMITTDRWWNTCA